MWLIFFMLAVLGVCVLLFHLSIELNKIDKSAADLAETIRKHYGIE